MLMFSDAKLQQQWLLNLLLAIIVTSILKKKKKKVELKGHALVSGHTCV